MPVDQQFQEIAAKIVPDLDAVMQDVRDAWRPALICNEVRESIFANPNLGAWVLDELLTLPEDASHQTMVSDTTLAMLTCLVETDVERLRALAGLVWHADQLARLISTGKLSISETKWDRGDVRIALSGRQPNRAPDVAEANFVHAVEESGAGCISAWLTTAPTAVKRALEISDSFLGKTYRMDKRSDQKAQIVAGLLNDIGAAT